MARADQQRIYNVLKEFRNLDSLKKLFWQELNYDRANEALSRRTWPERQANLLAEDPVLFATAGGDGDFHLIYCQLAADRLSIADERELVNRLYQDHPHALYIFSNRQARRWHLVNVKQQAGERRGQMLFRRIAVGLGEQLRTAAERIALLDVESLSPSLFGVSPMSIQERHDEAFDVEAVTRKFFEEYRRAFETVEATIRGIAEPERKRLFAQRLFNRLMFLAFVQKKGWLRYPGMDEETPYLQALWHAYTKTSAAGANFYRDRLRTLFFQGLNNRRKDAALEVIIGNVPYLNGGLFDEDDDDRDTAIVVPDAAIQAILLDLFARFNFTVTESTPLDVEVAVDPEMLGKIFEELVTGRHETGSYYTPKPVVSFMCREALKGYLTTAAPHEKPEEIARFVDEQAPEGLKDPEEVLDALRAITVCDPACGSGAYLLGMLHELLDLRASLFSARSVDQRSVYDRKLEIIQHNVYGVDIDPFAVNIARLRLWLSLVVDYSGREEDLPPLPNLDFKLEIGDSLSATLPTGGSQSSLYDDAKRRFREAKGRYMAAHGPEKAALREEIEKLQQEIASWVHADGSVASGFDWAVAFEEVFDRPAGRPGFDVVLANPPYVRQELIKEQKPRLQVVYPSVYTGTADLYCFFYMRAIELLRQGGMLVFISSNKWFRAGYGAKMRKYVADTCDVWSITDFGELPVFNAATFPMIFVARKGHTKLATIYTRVRSLEEPYPDVRAIIQSDGRMLPEDAIAGAVWTFASADGAAFLRRMEAAGIALDSYAEGRIYYGAKTGYNPAFVIKGLQRRHLIQEDPNSEEVIKPLIVGDNVRRWRVDQDDTWLIYAPWDFKIDRYPAIKRHLTTYREQLMARPECKAGRYKWWCMARYGAEYADTFDKPKIVFPDIAKEPRFALDRDGMYVLNTTYFVARQDLYLLGVLNSSATWAYAKERLTVLGDAEQGGRLRFFRQFVQALPIPDASPNDRSAITRLVSECLDARGVGCQAWEQEIDERVARLYGVNLADIKAPEPVAETE